MNSTGNCVFDTPTVIIKANSALSALSIPVPGTYVFDVNTNINQNQGQAGNAILNMNVTIEGYVNDHNDVLIGVNVSGGSRDTLVQGGSYTAPGYLPPSSQYGAQAVNSDGKPLNTVVTGLRVKGASKGREGRLANIYVANGRVTDCIADSISCVGPNCVESGNKVAILGTS
jgi:hypothetical protein